MREAVCGVSAADGCAASIRRRLRCRGRSGAYRITAVPSGSSAAARGCARNSSRSPARRNASASYSARCRSHQLRQSDRMQDTAGDSGRERFSRARQHRTSTPQRIARQGVRIVGQRVQEQIRQREAGQVLRIRERPAQTSSRRSLPSAALPPHAEDLQSRSNSCSRSHNTLPGTFSEQPHPDVEYRGGVILYDELKQQNTNPFSGRPAFRAAGCGALDGGDRSPGSNAGR